MAVKVRGVARTKRDRTGRRAHRSNRCCCLESGDGETWGDRVDATGGTRSVSPTDVVTSRSDVDSKRFRLASQKCHLSSVAVKLMKHLDSRHTVQCTTSNGRLLWCNYVKLNIDYLIASGASEAGQVEDGVSSSHDQFVGSEWQTTAIATSHPK